MKIGLDQLLILTCLFFISGCAHSSSEVKLSETKESQGVLFGHINISKNGTQLGTSWTTKCSLSFSNEKEDNLTDVKVDETGWIVAWVPIGNVYLSGIFCNSGFLQAHFTMKTRNLSFSVSSEKTAAYFGDVAVRFNYYRPSMWSGKVPTQVKIENHFELAKQEFQKRFGADTESFKLVDATMVRNPPSMSQDQ